MESRLLTTYDKQRSELTPELLERFELRMKARRAQKQCYYAKTDPKHRRPEGIARALLRVAKSHPHAVQEAPQR